MSIDDRPEWWDDYLGYLDSQEARHEGQDARIHEDGFGAGWTLGYEAGADAERARAERAEAEVARLREALVHRCAVRAIEDTCEDCQGVIAALAAPATADPNAPPKLVLRAAGIEV